MFSCCRIDFDDISKPTNLANSAVLRMLEEEENQKRHGRQSGECFKMFGFNLRNLISTLMLLFGCVFWGYGKSMFEMCQENDNNKFIY